MVVTRKQTKHDNLSLRFSPRNRIKLTFSTLHQWAMKTLWGRFRHYESKEDLTVTDLYREAFTQYLHKNRIPKVTPKVNRKQFELHLDDETVKMLNDLRKIALHRNVPLCIIVEEALQAYLDLPQNYLGKDLQKPGHLERIG